MSILKRFSGEFVKGSLILLISMNLFNFLNYVFHFVSARLLGPINYGILAVLMSIVYIFNIPNETIQTITSRYATKFNINKENGKIKNLIVKSIKRFLFLGIISFLVFTAISPFLGDFLFINPGLLILTGFTLIGIFLLPITRGALQGKKKFNSLGFSYLSEGVVKVAFTVSLILLGFGVYGAMGAVISGIFVSFAISFIPLRKVLKSKIEKEKIKGIYSYSIPVLISLTGITFLYSIDIILAKRFFPEEIVGNYAVISMLSKIIFFGTWPISKAMFPIASEKHDKKSGSMKIFKKSISIVFVLAAFALLIYFLIPKSIVRILYGSQYVSMASLLIYPSIAMAILALTNIFILYNLCIERGKRNYVILFFVVLQIVLLSLFHSSLIQFASMLILVNALLLFTMLILNFKK